MRAPDVDVAVDDFAAAIERALHAESGGNGMNTGVKFSLRDNSPGRNDGADEARLAALRVLGVDALAPFVLAGHRLDRDDAELIEEAVRVFPAPRPEDTGSAALWWFRDWALASTLGTLAPGADLPVPDRVPVELSGAAPWPDWCAQMMTLAALALPGIRCAARAAATHRRLDLGRGLARAILRRDHLGAARLARWLALDPPAPDPATADRASATADQASATAGQADPVTTARADSVTDDRAGEDELALPAALTHLALLGRDQPLVLLQVTVARLLLERNR